MMSAQLEGLATIQSLPEQVRGRIFNLFPQRETLNLRLVCKQWNHDVNEYYDFKVDNLDETSEDFKRQCHLRIRDLGILRLKETAVVQPDGTTVLKFPNIITSLKILSSADSNVSLSNVQALLGLSAKALVFLEIQNWMFDNTSLDSHPGYNFQKLTDLRLEVYLTDTSIVGFPLLSALRNSTMPNLKHFWARLHGGWKGSLRGQEALLIIRHFLKIVAKSGPGLETLCLGYGNRTVGLWLIQDQDDLDFLNSLKNLKRVSTNLKLIGCGPVRNVWKDILARQTSLVDLNYSESSWIMTVPFDLAQTIVSNNYRTLTSVTLGWITYPTHGPGLDLAIFGPCQGLQKLILFGQDGDRFRVQGKEPSYVNFHRLPSSLKYLYISWAQLLASEVLRAFENGLGNLEVLALSNPLGKYERVQFSSSILAKILSSGSLLEVDVRKMNPGKSHTQQRKYESILNKFMINGYEYPAGGLDKRLKVIRASAKDRWGLGSGVLEDRHI